MVHQKQTRQVEGEFDMEIVSLIVQQLHAGVISLLPFVPIWLILLNLVTYIIQNNIFKINLYKFHVKSSFAYKETKASIYIQIQKEMISNPKQPSCEKGCSQKRCDIKGGGCSDMLINL